MLSSVYCSKMNFTMLKAGKPSIRLRIIQSPLSFRGQTKSVKHVKIKASEDEQTIDSSGSSVSETNKETNLGDKIDGSEVPGSGKGPLAVASILGAVLLFSLTRFGGDGVDLKSLAATAIPYDEALSNGKPTLVEFYADWCEVCREEAKDVFSVGQDFREKVNFVMLNIDNLKWTPEIDEFGVDGIPHFVFLDGQKNELGFVVGRLPKNILEANLEALASGNDNIPYSQFVGQYSSKDNSIARTSRSSDPRSHG